MMNSRMFSLSNLCQYLSRDCRRSSIESAISEASEGHFSRFINSELLKPQLLLSVIMVSSYTTGNSDTAAIQAALDAAQTQGGGAIVQFDARTYNISSTLQVHSGTTLLGTPNNGTTLNFSLSGPSYGMTIDASGTSVTIQALNLISSSGVIGMYGGGNYSHIHITGNSLQFGGGSTPNGTAIFGIYGTNPNDDLQITSNYFHDSPTSVRDWEIWDASNANLDYNTLYKVVDGGHICEPGANVSYSNNYGVNLKRMGQEIQGSSVGTGLKVNNNTFYDWVTPYYDSFGMSVVNHSSTGTEIGNNFLKADIASGSTWGIADGGGANRFGYAIEAGGEQMNVHDNTIVGDWIAGVVASRLYVNVTDNAKYGPANWGDWIGEPSIDGYGSVILTGDTVDRDTADAPVPPALDGNPTYVYNPKLDGTPASQTAPDGGTTGTSTGSTAPGGGWTTTTGTGTGTTTTGGGTTTTGGGTVTTLGPQNTGITTSGETAIGSAVEIDPAADTTRVTGTLGTLTVTPLSSTTARLKWTQNPSLVGTNNNVPSISLFEVDVQSTVGKEHFPSVLYTSDLVSATVINLHPGWQIDFTASAYTSDGKLYRSGPVNALMPGNSLTDFTGLLWGGISSIHTPHS